MKSSALVPSIIAIILSAAAVSLEAGQSIPLFDGKTLDGWTTEGGQAVTRGWEAVDGMLHLNTDGERGGNIFTDREYGDFELSFEWKIAAGGNNGVKYRVRKFGNKTLGCEYQLIDDDGYLHKLPATGTTGSLYDIYEPSAAKSLNAIGQFNHSRIVVCGNRIEHWLNGQLIVVARVGSSEWDRRIADSKFSDVESFGRNRMGKIMLTDHNSEVWYRNIELTPLSVPTACPPVDQCDRRPRGLLRRIFRRR
jgi:hypothetical protein